MGRKTVGTKNEVLGPMPRGFFDEDVVFAILSRITDSFHPDNLDRELRRACKEYGGIFAEFNEHGHYSYSKRFSDIRAQCIHTSTLWYTSGELREVKCSEHVRGPWGAKKYQRFTPRQREVIDEIARNALKDEVRKSA